MMMEHHLIILSLSLSLYIYAIMKTMYPPGYHHNGFAATHAVDVRLHIAGTSEPKSALQAKQGAYIK